MKNIFVFDLDGTLLRSSNSLHPKTLEAFREKSKNSIIAIATGRSLTKSKDVIKQIPFLDYFFANNGNVIRDFKHEKIETQGFLSQDLYAYARDFALANNLILQMDTDQNSFIVYDESKHSHLVDKSKLMDMNKDVLATIEDCDRAVFDNNEKIVQIALRDKQDTVHDHLKHIQNMFGKDFEVVLTNRIFIDVNPIGVSKADAISYLKNKYGKDTTIYAFGDSSNDRSMLQAADIAVALGNATDDLKEVADIIIGDHETSAIADFLENI